ncbi:hypothetical protein NDU88_010057 [Pleurodeles waltl]|uniref:Uncharacterized protein n=1 Tax=Pleurodeles waltl TaxID=8319 RepID=A0AAV7PWZ1_PLEWA|nr:hypothetical protein NDU88_010057 [Pleurodeles waltl]
MAQSLPTTPSWVPSMVFGFCLDQSGRATIVQEFLAQGFDQLDMAFIYDGGKTDPTGTPMAYLVFLGSALCKPHSQSSHRPAN